MIITRKQFNWLNSQVGFENLEKSDYAYMSNITGRNVSNYGSLKDLALDEDGNVLGLKVDHEKMAIDTYISDGYGYVRIKDFTKLAHLNIVRYDGLVYILKSNGFNPVLTKDKSTFNCVVNNKNLFVFFFDESGICTDLIVNNEKVRIDILEYFDKCELDLLFISDMIPYEKDEIQEYEDEITNELQSYSDDEWIRITESYSTLFNIVEASENKDAYRELLKLLRSARN